MSINLMPETETLAHAINKHTQAINNAGMLLAFAILNQRHDAAKWSWTDIQHVFGTIKERNKDFI